MSGVKQRRQPAAEIQAEIKAEMDKRTAAKERVKAQVRAAAQQATVDAEKNAAQQALVRSVGSDPAELHLTAFNQILEIYHEQVCAL